MGMDWVGFVVSLPARRLGRSKDTFVDTFVPVSDERGCMLYDNTRNLGSCVLEPTWIRNIPKGGLWHNLPAAHCGLGQL
jgi:hypothetical protein